MRPRELTLEGFRSYRSSTTFDWRDRRLVGIVGPIGAGKSSILDAISFALYGKTPNIERDTRSLIHQLCDACHVELRFEVDGQAWRAVRALRRKGQAGHQLELLDGDGPDAEVVERVMGERAVNDRVEQLLGMDFRAFCRSVLLAQNRFHEFLRATPGDRDRVLKGVFGYDRLDDAQRIAKLRLERVAMQLDAFGAERNRIDEARTQLEAARGEAEATAELLSRLEAAATEVERLAKEHDAARAEAERASEEAVQAEVAHETARTRLQDAQHAEMARTLRGDLHAGEPCPVCAQPVHAVPKAGAAPKVTAAERAVAKAATSLEAARTRRERIASAFTAAQTSAAGAAAAIVAAADAAAAADEERAAALAALDATRSQLVEWLGEEGEIQALFESREAELTAAEEAVAAAKEAVQEHRDVLDRAREEAAGSAHDLAQLANRLAGSWGRLGRDDAVPAEQEEVRAAFRAIREAIVAAHEDAVAVVESAGARAVEAERGLADLFAAIGLGPSEDFTTALAGAGVRHGAAMARVAELEATIARAGDLEADILAAETQRDLADRLAKDLQPSRFLAFLLEEERAELAELGSEHLDQLTGGGYRFSEDDRFDIVDLNAAGQVRRSDSLSGGETFLASLALALALAEMVARGGGRLDAFFLDEGFGSLDPEHLDRAMEGIGRLVAGDEHRVVVLVSHVAEMREAIEDLVILDKDDLTGDTLVLAGASPA
jgi:exonuclease SbcC